MSQIEGCDAKPVANGLCAKNYMRARRKLRAANGQAGDWQRELCRRLVDGDAGAVTDWLAAQVPADRLATALHKSAARDEAQAGTGRARTAPYRTAFTGPS